MSRGWHITGKVLPIGEQTLVMGILNVTPDSFSDGGVHFETRIAIEAARRMMEEGADLIDVGGESTRPGSEAVEVQEELQRVLPVIEQLVRDRIPVSIDTAKASVGKAAVEAGAVVINDVTALSDPEMASVCAKANCFVCLMHMQGTPRTMQKDPVYTDVVEDVRSFLISRAEYAESQGVQKGKIWIDPGIGFGKTVDHNLLLLRHLDRIVDSEYPVLIGTSRKSFIGKALGQKGNPLPSDDRLEGTLATQIWAQIRGARIIRAHDVLAARRAIDMTALLAES
jgi:dihydropteroate synthase